MSQPLAADTLLAMFLDEVRDLLVELRDRLELLDQVPALVDQVGEIHAAVTKLVEAR